MAAASWAYSQLTSTTTITAAAAGAFLTSDSIATALVCDGHRLLLFAAASRGGKAALDEPLPSVASSTESPPAVALECISSAADAIDLLFVLRTDSSWQLLRIDEESRGKCRLLQDASGRLSPPPSVPNTDLFHRREGPLCVSLPLLACCASTCAPGRSAAKIDASTGTEGSGGHAVVVGIYYGWLAVVTIVRGSRTDIGDQVDLALADAGDVLPVAVRAVTFSFLCNYWRNTGL
eukprot:SAG31_NODE_1217_length_9319_cov_20.281345_2_plen_235_part_00